MTGNAADGLGEAVCSGDMADPAAVCGGAGDCETIAPV
jgi:hypothetical protein